MLFYFEREMSKNFSAKVAVYDLPPTGFVAYILQM